MMPSKLPQRWLPNSMNRFHAEVEDEAKWDFEGLQSAVEGFKFSVR